VALMFVLPVLAAGEGDIDYALFNKVIKEGNDLSHPKPIVEDTDAVVPEGFTEAKAKHWDYTTAGSKNMDDSDQTAYAKVGFSPKMEDSGYENTNGVDIESNAYDAARDDPDLDNERAQSDRGCYPVTSGAAPATSGIFYPEGSVIPVHKDADMVLDSNGRFCPDPVAGSACRDATPPELKAAWGEDTSCPAMKGQCGAHMGAVEDKCPVTCGLCAEGGEANALPVHCYAVLKGDTSPQPGTFYPKEHPFNGVLVHSAGVTAPGPGKFCPDPDTDAHPGMPQDQPHYHADPAAQLPMPPQPHCSNVWSDAQCEHMEKIGACHYHVLDNCKLACGACANGHMPMVPGAQHPQDRHHPSESPKHCIPMKKFQEAPATGSFTVTGHTQHPVHRHAVAPADGTFCFANCDAVIEAGARAPIAGWFFSDAKLHGEHVEEGHISEGPGSFCAEGHGESPVDDYVHMSKCKDASSQELQAALELGDVAITCAMAKGQCGKHDGKVTRLCPVTCKVKGCEPKVLAPFPGNGSGSGYSSSKPAASYGSGSLSGSPTEDAKAEEAAREATNEFDKLYYGSGDTSSSATTPVPKPEDVVADAVRDAKKKAGYTSSDDKQQDSYGSNAQQQASGYSSSYVKVKAEHAAAYAVAKAQAKGYASSIQKTEAHAAVVHVVAKAKAKTYSSAGSSSESAKPKKKKQKDWFDQVVDEVDKDVNDLVGDGDDDKKDKDKSAQVHMLPAEETELLQDGSTAAAKAEAKFGFGALFGGYDYGYGDHKQDDHKEQKAPPAAGSAAGSGSLPDAAPMSIVHHMAGGKGVTDKKMKKKMFEGLNQLDGVMVTKSKPKAHKKMSPHDFMKGFLNPAQDIAHNDAERDIEDMVDPDENEQLWQDADTALQSMGFPTMREGGLY